MAEESIRRKNQISNSTSSSSDRDVDPDYTAELPRWQFRGLRDTASTSTGRAKRQCTIRNNDNRKEVRAEDEHDCHIVEGFTSGKKSSSITTSGRNKHNDDEKKKKSATIFSWLIDSKAIEEDDEIFCKDEHNRIIKDGRIKREGIQCSCCQQIFTSDNFVIHGGSITNQSWDRIFTPKHQVSLFSVMIDAWNKPEHSKLRTFNSIETTIITSDKYDDACVICADGGMLMCCDECNSTYHRYCIDLQVVPSGSWYCPYCVCRFCGDPSRGSDYLLKCPQCGKKYHWGCHLGEDSKMIDLNNIPSAPFCERSCKEVQDHLRSMIGVKNDLDGGFSWSLLRCTDNIDSDLYLDDTYTRTVCHSKLAVAQKLMEDCFERIIDRHSGVDVISGVIYNCGSNFTRIDFKGFYTAVLEKNEEIVSVATLRIHGTNLAEMPFIATSDLHRCKGMCKKLMVAIESALCYLNVEKLVISSTSEMENNWIEKYGFRHLDYTVNKEIMGRNTLMFHDSKRLYKTLVVSHSTNPGRSESSKPSWRKPRTKRQHHFPIFAQKTSIASMFEMAFQQQPE